MYNEKQKEYYKKHQKKIVPSGVVTIRNLILNTNNRETKGQKIIRDRQKLKYSIIIQTVKISAFVAGLKGWYFSPLTTLMEMGQKCARIKFMGRERCSIFGLELINILRVFKFYVTTATKQSDNYQNVHTNF